MYSTSLLTTTVLDGDFKISPCYPHHENRVPSWIELRELSLLLSSLMSRSLLYDQGVIFSAVSSSVVSQWMVWLSRQPRHQSLLFLVPPDVRLSVRERRAQGVR